MYLWLKEEAGTHNEVLIPENLWFTYDRMTAQVTDK